MANIRFKNALNRIPQKIPPIWMMRQAGRYHSHYQRLKKFHSFIELCKSPKLAAEVALGPIDEFDFDVAILFSDILYPLEALGMDLDYDPGPKFKQLLTEETLLRFCTPDLAAEKLLFQYEAIAETRRILPDSKSLIGFVGGPWTLFGYAMEGRHDGAMIKSKSSTSLYFKFNEYLLPLLKKNISLQLQAGAELVMIFDTSAGSLSPILFEDLVLPKILELASSFPNQIGYYAKGVSNDVMGLLSQVEGLGQGFDHRVDLVTCLKGKKCGFVQGNFDQSLLHLQTSEFESQLNRYLDPIVDLSENERQGWVCGLGHGIMPETPEMNVKRFVQIVRERFQ